MRSSGCKTGSFENGYSHWRLLGNHGQHGLTQVVLDPDDPTNHVLHLVAHGATEHMSNHLETTFSENARIRSSRTYRISFRARWLAGSPQLHSRLYFNRLAATHILPQPASSGTPGRENSQRVQNLGPTFHELRHFPAVPAPGEETTVSLRIDDPHGIASARLFYAADGEDYTSVAMGIDDRDSYVGKIPGFPVGQIVRFHVEATDQLGATSLYPPNGPDEPALFRVNDGEAADAPFHNLRIIMTHDDIDQLFTRTNFTSNERLNATVIWQESDVYHNVGVRLKGSGFSRGSGATGFNLRFSPDRLLFGEHDVVAIDRTGGPWGIGASHRELTIKHIANRAGNIPMMYDDVIHIMGPRDALNGSAQFLTARYDDVFLESQFENGGEGTRFKFELIYYSTLTEDGDPESLKFPPSSSRAGVFPVRGIDMPYMGDDSNAYRWYYLIRNNRDRDDYSSIIAMTNAMRSTSSTVGSTLDLLTQEAMDVDQWMRVFAFESLAGINDTFNQGLQHNLQLYVRPSDGRVLALPWDMDFSLHHDTSMNIYGTGSRLRRVINIPTNRRVFQQHLLDIIETSYNRGYLTDWVNHLATRARRDATNDILNYIRSRRSFVLSRLDDQVPFEITTPNDDPIVVDAPHVTLEGKGWIDVREIRMTGDEETTLPVQWLNENTWRTIVPLSTGTQSVQLKAYNLRGEEVGSDQVVVTTSNENPLRSGLRVTELNYHPHEPNASELAAGWTDADDFEFIEVTNVGDVPLSLADVRFVQELPNGENSGIEFAFPEIEIDAGKSIVIAKNTDAYSLRYGDSISPIGEYGGRLSNGGETIRLVGPGNEVIQQFTYRDAWFSQTDGDGYALEIRSADTASVDRWSDSSTWRASRVIGGTPGYAPLPDFSRDNQLSVEDVDLLCAAIRDSNLEFDLNDDGKLDDADMISMIEDAMNSTIGDVNFDGRFDSGDLVAIFQQGQYEDQIANNSKYESGDWNCDGDFTTSDLVFAFRNSNYKR